MANHSPRTSAQNPINISAAKQLAFMLLESNFRCLNEARQRDEEWENDGNKATVDLAVGLVQDRFKGVLQKQYPEFYGFYSDWVQLGCVIDLAVKSFPRKDSLYWRYLKSLKKAFDVMGEAIEIAHLKGGKQ